MFESAKQVYTLLRATRKAWLLPFILLLIIIALIAAIATATPVPVFLYPVI